MSKIVSIFCCALCISILAGCGKTPSREVETFSVNGVDFKMIKVEAGILKFDGGEIELTKDFYIGQTEVTQELWYAVMQRRHMWFQGGDLPAECVSWNDAMKFCEQLNKKVKLSSGWKFTLPTEAQWEFAARGGNKSRGYRYSGSNDISEVCHMGSRICDVARYKCNELGLYDMSGNAGEWCLNDYDGEQKNEFSRGNDKGGTRAYRSERGGLYGGIGTPSSRYKMGDYEKLVDVGFRIVLVNDN